MGREAGTGEGRMRRENNAAVTRAKGTEGF